MLKFSEIFEFSREKFLNFERTRMVRMVRMVQMVRMVRSLADRTFQLCSAPVSPCALAVWSSSSIALASSSLSAVFVSSIVSCASALAVARSFVACLAIRIVVFVSLRRGRKYPPNVRYKADASLASEFLPMFSNSELERMFSNF